MGMALLLRFSVTWLLLGLGFAGIGVLLARLFKNPPRSLESWLMTFWVGWAFSIALMQLWSFVYPINDGIRYVLVGLSVIGWLLISPLFASLTGPSPYGEEKETSNRRSGEVIRATRRVAPTVTMNAVLWTALPLVYMVVFVIWLANRSALFPDSFDTALYHLQTIRWSMEHPAVPGLGNLHSRLAFSNGYFLYPALLNSGFWFERSYHITSGLLYGVMMSQIVVSAVSLLRGEWRLYRAYYALFFPVMWFLFLTDRTIPSVTNDAPLFPLGVVVSGELLKLLELKNTSVLQARYQMLVIVLLACVGVAIKFSFIALGGLASAFALIYVLLRHTEGTSARLFILAIAVFTALFVLIPMMGRSVIMTGYPLYPLDVAAFDVDWRLADDWPAREQNTIRSWAFGLPEGQTNPFSDFGWLGTWLRSLWNSYYHIMTAVFGLAGLSAIVLFWAFWKRRKSATGVTFDGWWLAPVIAGMGGVIFWFFTAPLLRFIGALPWIIAFGLLVVTISVVFPGSLWRKRIVIILIIALSIPPLRLLLREPWIEPGPEKHGLYYLPYVATEPFVSEYGVEVGIPVVYDMCFDSSLPCAPPPSLKLQYRDADGDLRAGFRIGE